ncbi:MAG: hypothetical protein IT317_16550 [Anaerolineales bacterium]|nr:hypothetical protein [Anaerolineales bacterium]
MTDTPTRQRLSLDGVWDLLMDGELSPRAAKVPGAWQAQFRDLAERPGAGAYTRRFSVGPEWAGHAAILHFGAADYYAEVWVNDQIIGAHEGGYLPFEFDISAALRPGERNTLRVRVVDPGDLPPGALPPFSHVPHGKQSWYGAVGGLWQSVWLERRAPTHLHRLTLSVNPHAGLVTVALALSVPAPAGCALQLALRAPHGGLTAEQSLSLAPGQAEAEMTLLVPAPQWWSPDAPHLYQIEARLLAGGTVADVTARTFGFRTIEARAGALYLNGSRLYLRAALDQDYYPGTFYTPPSAAFIDDQFRKAKAMGLNCLRCHIKVADPAYLDAADRLGLLVWAELPNWRHFTPTGAEAAQEVLRGMLARDGHHPAILLWTIINEGWGLNLKDDPTHRAWLREMYHWLRALDPSRLVVDNSACHPNFHLASDLDDFHFYAALPDHRARWDQFVADYAARPAWTFSPHGDAVRTGREPLLVSEFGNWGLPDADTLLDPDGREPWWFETGLEWGEGIVYPHGVQARFRRWGLDAVFGSWRAFITATQWHQFAALKYQIEAMRRYAAIVGYVITEFTDVHWECNGLLDMQRRPKAYHDRLADLNADLVIVPAWTRTAYWAGEAIELNVSVSHGMGAPLRGAALAWRWPAGDGRRPLPDLEAGQVADAGALVLLAPEVSSATVQRLELEVLAADGRVAARSYLDLSLLPRPATPDPAVTLWADSPALADHLRGLGYAVTESAAAARVLVAQTLTPELLAAVRAGARLLLLADGPGVLAETLDGVRLAPRQDTLWSGDWASSFSWVRRQGPFAALPGGPLLDHSFDRVIPDYVIAGLMPLDFEANVHAGLLLGWVHKVVALAATMPAGRGQMVVTTFRLLQDAPGADPVATTLLHGLLATALA